MPVQEYKINTRDAVVGSLYGLQQTRADIQTVFVENTAGIGFGVAVNIGAGERGVVLGGAAHVTGISIRQLDREALTRPSDGTVVFRKGDALPMLTEGRINVKVGDAGNIVRDAPVFVNTLTGEFFIAAGTDRVKCTNVVWGLSGTRAMGDIEHVRITNADIIVA